MNNTTTSQEHAATIWKNISEASKALCKYALKTSNLIVDFVNFCIYYLLHLKQSRAKNHRAERDDVIFGASEEEIQLLHETVWEVKNALDKQIHQNKRCDQHTYSRTFRWDFQAFITRRWTSRELSVALKFSLKKFWYERVVFFWGAGYVCWRFLFVLIEQEECKVQFITLTVFDWWISIWSELPRRRHSHTVQLKWSTRTVRSIVIRSTRPNSTECSQQCIHPILRRPSLAIWKQHVQQIICAESDWSRSRDYVFYRKDAGTMRYSVGSSPMIKTIVTILIGKLTTPKTEQNINSLK